MTGKDMFMMNQKERKKPHVIRKVIQKEISQVEAGLAIDLTDRQIKRLVKRIRGFAIDLEARDRTGGFWSAPRIRF
ncbi:MAG: hypothetical protein ACHQYP_09680 [Nitrospiria bacterium]